MRRADRLLQIVQILRREKKPLAASRIAQELEVSLRTLYRDMVALEASGVPIRGEAGVGYVLEEGYDLPPLMFTADELEALIVGARMVDGRLDEQITRATRDAVAKIETVLPEDLRRRFTRTPIYAPLINARHQRWSTVLREALRADQALHITYEDLKGNRSERTVWPVLMSLFDETTVLVAWCCTRQDFRSFRIERIRSLEPTGEKSGRSRERLQHEWRKMQSERGWMSPARDKFGRIYGI